MKVHQEKWALLIGIDDYPFFPRDNQLEGCVNDVEMMTLLLRECFRFSVEGIQVLRNEAAHRVAIFEALDSLAAKIQPGDLVVIFFSGHGSRQYEDEADDEPDRWDETLVPHDSGREPYTPCDITDDELRQRLLPIVQRAGQVVVWVDACRSASVLRDEEEQQRVRWVEPGTRARRPIPSTLETDLDPSRYVLLAACADTEGAYELTAEETGDGRTHGAFSWHLGQTLTKMRPGTTWRDVYEQLIAAVRSSRPMQTPQVEGAQDRLIFQGEWKVPEAFIPVVETTQQQEILLAGGWLQGVTAGAVYGVHPAGARCPRVAERLAQVRIERVGATEASASFLTPTVDLSAACRAFLEQQGEERFQTSVTLAGCSEHVQRMIHHSPWLRLAASEERPWIRVERLGGGQPSCPRLAGLDLPASGWLLLDLGGAPLGVTNLDPADLLLNLEGWARYRYLLHLENPRWTTSGANWIELDLLNQAEDGSWQGGVGEDVRRYGLPCFFDGDRLGLAIRNCSGRDLYVGVLNLGVSGAVSLLYPAPGAKELLVTGGHLALGQGLRGKIRLRLPSRNRRPLQSAGGIETVKLLASATPLDLGIWIQSSLRESDHRKPSAEAMAGFAIEPPQEIWTTNTRSFHLLPRRQ